MMAHAVHEIPANQRAEEVVVVHVHQKKEEVVVEEIRQLQQAARSPLGYSRVPPIYVVGRQNDLKLHRGLVLQMAGNE